MIKAATASVAILPHGDIMILEPTALHTIDKETLSITSTQLEEFGYHKIGASSRYVLLSQEHYR